MKEKKKCSGWRVFGGTVAFWLLSFGGGIILLLWNALSPIRYSEGDLGYFFLKFASTAFGVGIAIYAYSSITLGESLVGLLVNSIVGVVVFLILSLFSTSLFGFLSMLVAVVVYIVCAVYCGKEISRKCRDVDSQKNK